MNSGAVANSTINRQIFAPSSLISLLFTTTMAEDYYSIENRIQRALDATKREKNPNLSEIARKFDVPYQRLRRRVKGGASRSTRPPAGRRLSESQ